MNLVSRSEWQARPAKTVTPFITKPSGCALHWEGPRMGAFGHDQCAGKVRGIQRFHLDSRGWADIAYNFLVCPHGYVFTGRGLFARSAAQGSNDGNAKYLAICYLGGQGDPFTAEGRVGFADAIGYCRKAGGAGFQVLPHRAFRSTECPGNDIVAWINAGMPGGSPTVPQPPSGDDDFRRRVMANPVLSQGATGHHVRIMQALLIAHAKDLVPSLGFVDGDFGPSTSHALRVWQARTGKLAPDGVCGPATWLWLVGQ